VLGFGFALDLGFLAMLFLLSWLNTYGVRKGSVVTCVSSRDLWLSVLFGHEKSALEGDPLAL
jgi:hypothetical protein